MKALCNVKRLSECARITVDAVGVAYFIGVVVLVFFFTHKLLPSDKPIKPHWKLCLHHRRSLMLDTLEQMELDVGARVANRPDELLHHHGINNRIRSSLPDLDRTGRDCGSISLRPLWSIAWTESAVISAILPV